MTRQSSKQSAAGRCTNGHQPFTESVVITLGRKSRIRRERRIQALLREAAERVEPQSTDELDRQHGQLQALYSRFNAEDVCLSLGVSNLWLLNISSQIKHTFALGVLASMPSERFTTGNRINTYEQFRDFLGQVHALLPSFPMLEDYVPEADWGEVKINWTGALYRIYYGATVERIPDFITAFGMIHGGNEAALRDMRAALTLQYHIIDNIDRSIVGNVAGVAPGHLEIPEEPFWSQCRHALLQASELVETARLSDGLAMEVGDWTPPREWFEFGDAVMTGTALPPIVLRIGKRRFPTILRDAPGQVIEYWADKRPLAADLVPGVSAAIGAFLAQRLDARKVLTGPFQLITGGVPLPYLFAAAIREGSKIHLIAAITDAFIPQLPKLESEVQKLLSSGAEWAIQRPGFAGLIQPGGPDGTRPTIREFVLTAVLAQVTTVNRAVRLSRTKVHVLPLPDFITVFDSTEDMAELERFWSFIERDAAVVGSFSSVADRFAAFRDTRGVLVDGAIAPHFIGLDPHWGSNWRYERLASFWSSAPPLVPFDENTAWKVERHGATLYRLTSRSVPVLSWCTVVNNCVVHFMLDVYAQPLKPEDGRVLELVVQLLADSLSKRNAAVSILPIFGRQRIVTMCQVDLSLLATGAEDLPADEQPLFSKWLLHSEVGSESVQVTVQTNLRRSLQRVMNPTDASFEADAVGAWIDGISQLLGVLPDPAVLAELVASGKGQPRFIMTTMRRSVDVPEYAQPVLPELDQYKVARRDLAVVFKELGATRGTYEPVAAKQLIDPARTRLRKIVESRIATLERQQLVPFCIEQIDSLIGKFDRDTTTVEISVAHEVEYDRAAKLAEAHKSFVRESRNYRYLLECGLSLPAAGTQRVTPETVTDILASIDWLLVLDDASDTLYHDLDVADLELDDFFVPTIHYSEDRTKRESAFAAEMADLRLGVGIRPEDKVSALQAGSEEFSKVNDAFLQDVGVRFDDFAAGLLVLSRWASYCGDETLRWSYAEQADKVRQVLVESVKDLTAEQADRIITVATLDPRGIRRLIGKAQDESAVPIWEHNKRGNRFTIKPIIQQSSGGLLWGAASAERAAHIWSSSIANGYLPADFPWQKVSEAVRLVKSRLEQQLETTSCAIVRRATPYAVPGIDFMRRFPKEQFEDAGDYDVLAYWPETNRWLVVECKYNQPAFCLKDARRLRDRIFGTVEDRAQFAKIERRRNFLHANLDRLRDLLNWPLPQTGTEPRVTELYVSREIYWWMRNPPYEVPAQFVRVDVLDHWLRQNGLLQ